jgi:hypothetical protein
VIRHAPQPGLRRVQRLDGNHQIHMPIVHNAGAECGSKVALLR